MKKISLLVCAALAMGSAPKKGCPDDMVRARPGVCIDRYEYSNVRGAKPQLGYSAVFADSGPVWDAENVCENHGKRTCTRSEWVAACQGPGGSKFPYGQKYVAGKCNTDQRWRTPDPAKVEKRDEAELARLDQSAPAGSFEECVSESGAYDMVGNAEEWVRCDAGQEDENGTKWCLVGGYWAATTSSCTYVITKHAPMWHYYETSFRCCLDMEE